jgi:excisionase family DNA binding protein
MTTRKPGSLKPYTTGEIAKELGVNLRTVIRMLEAGAIPFHWSENHGRRLVRVKDWNAWRRDNMG